VYDTCHLLFLYSVKHLRDSTTQVRSLNDSIHGEAESTHYTLTGNKSNTANSYPQKPTNTFAQRIQQFIFSNSPIPSSCQAILAAGCVSIKIQGGGWQGTYTLCFLRKKSRGRFGIRLIGVRIQTHRKSSKYNQSMDPIPPLIGYTTIHTVIQAKMIVLELD
jgi:hypothetical protein